MTTLILWQVFGVIGISVCYHRQLSHRAFQTGGSLLALHLACALLAGQDGPISWVRIHRAHHARADTPLDPHSPRDGFWHSHAGWAMSKAAWRRIEDLAPDLRDVERQPLVQFFEHFHSLLLLTTFVLFYGMAGWAGVCWFGCFRVTLTLHTSWAVNSIGHSFGYRNCDTPDDSRNSLALALCTGGEGLHNNHHRFPGSARLKMRAFELDPAWYYLRMLMATGLAWNVRVVDPTSLESQVLEVRSFVAQRSSTSE